MNTTESILLTDLYQLTMLQGYFEQGMQEPAVFELFIRDLPPDRGFYVAAGLEQVVEFLEQARFTADDLDWLRRSGKFSDAFVDSLADWRFTGSLHAMPEGTLCFPNEPLARVTAPKKFYNLQGDRILAARQDNCRRIQLHGEVTLRNRTAGQ